VNPTFPFIDLRSDACSQPTETMRQAMHSAHCGNDDFQEDPTINELECHAADLLGKEASLFVHSGTMANLIAVMAQVQPTQSVLISKHFHIYDYEEVAMRRVAQCDFQFLDTQTNGYETSLVLDHEHREIGTHTPLLCIENTINRLGGTLLTLDQLERIRAWATSHEIKIHLDGARLLNAAAALQVAPNQITSYADTVMLVFTKALSAPAGAVLAGTSELIRSARSIRWMLGGAWKQGGMFAAACQIGLETMRDRIHEDHATAKILAHGLNSINGLSVDLPRVVTNIVFLKVENSEIDLRKFVSYLESHGAKIGRFKPDRKARLVTHRHIHTDNVLRFLDLVRTAVSTCLIS